MSSISGEEHPLLAAGWWPGATFQLKEAYYALNDFDTITTKAKDSNRRQLREREQLVLISHPCDMVHKDEKYVEALICKVHPPEDPQLQRWKRNSARYFVVNSSIALVADAMHRVKVAKSALLHLIPTPPAMNELHADAFREWLARRYDRPVVTDRLYNLFHRKVFKSFTDMEASHPEILRAFNHCVIDFRFQVPREDSTPCSTHLIYLTESRLSQVSADSISAVHRLLKDAVLPDVFVGDPPIISSLDEVPFVVIRKSQPVSMEYLSVDYVDGLDDDAAPPVWLLHDEN